MSGYWKRKERQEAAERNQVEGKFGQGKRGYGLNDIRTRFSSKSNSWIGTIIFVMNLIRHISDIPLLYFVSLLLNLMKVRNINIYPLRPQMNFCA
nr:transposase [Proteiniphilum sp. UBA5384]